MVVDAISYEEESEGNESVKVADEAWRSGDNVKGKFAEEELTSRARYGHGRGGEGCLALGVEG